MWRKFHWNYVALRGNTLLNLIIASISRIVDHQITQRGRLGLLVLRPDIVLNCNMM